jgi:signal transduction histidine kinase
VWAYEKSIKQKTKSLHDKNVQIEVKNENLNTSIVVSDTGIGMPSTTINKILNGNSFTTQGTSAELGTGLGLIICKNFVLENNGKFLIESKDGEGSTFKIILPNKYQS